MYYPKNKIQTDLYTNGSEYLILATQTPYTGYYYKTYTGKVFSGKSPSDISSQELTPWVSYDTAALSTSNTPTTIYQTSGEYADLPPTVFFEKEPNLSKQLPYTVTITPTQADYTKGNFVRMFAKKANEPKFFQIDEAQFKKLTSRDPKWDWAFYIPFSLTWVLTGNELSVSSTNNATVDRIQRTLRVYGFQQYIELNGGYNKFYK